MVRSWSVDICGLVIRYGLFVNFISVSYTHLDVYKRQLLDSGISSEDLIYYGLEYKYLTLYVLGELSFNEMFHQLEIAIHQFAKRQMTWFRGMERRGFTIHWLDACLPMEDKVEKIINLLHTKN